MYLRSIRSTSKAGLARGRLLSICAGVFVVLALTLLIVSLALAAPPSFPDVPTTHPFYEAISDLASRGIINGYSTGYFGPGDPVTRQQFAKMMVGTGGYPVAESDICPFTDVETSGPDSFYPDNFVAVCAAHGITTGKTATTFDPYSSIIRYQVISMVVRAADDLEPGLLSAPPADWMGSAGWKNDPTHGANAARAEYNGLLVGLDMTALSPYGVMSRGEVAQVLHNLLGKLPPTTTTTEATTTTTEVTTTSSSTTSSSTTSTTAPPQGYESLGGVLASGAGASRIYPLGSDSYRLDVFVRGPFDSLWSRTYVAGSWSSWFSLGEVVNSDPAAAGHVLSDRIDVLWLGTDKAIWHKWWDGKVWHRESLGGTFTSGPAAVGEPDVQGRDLHVFARGTDNALWYKTYLWWTGWSPWKSLGGALTSDPAALYNGDFYVFARGADLALWCRRYDSSTQTWGSWERLGGILVSGPTAAYVGEGKFQVFAVGVENTLWQKIYDESAGGWSDWLPVPGSGVTFTSDPEAVSARVGYSPPQYHVHLFIRGADNALWHKWWDGSSWRP